jgi:hypothetical protein
MIEIRREMMVVSRLISYVVVLVFLVFKKLGIAVTA